MNNDSFEVGDVVEPLRDILFTDGSMHKVGIPIVIKIEEEVFYYNAMKKYYQLSVIKSKERET